MPTAPAAYGDERDAACEQPPSNPAAPPWHAELVRSLPAVRGRAMKSFRRLPPADREEAVADVTAEVARTLSRLHDRGRYRPYFLPAVTAFAVRRHRSGCRVGSPVHRRDLLSPVPRRECRPETGGHAALDSAADRRGADPAERAAVRLDFAAFRDTLRPRDRALVDLLGRGHRPSEVADRLGVSRGRVSQLRADLRARWHAFTGEAVPAATPAAV